MSVPPPSDNGSKETARIEAFSDGVFAIAITLLVLELRVPRDLPETASLVEALANQWPVYLAFISSFATIGIMWINHHRMFSLLRRSDTGLMVLNLLLLMGITIVPFPTALVAEYIQHPDRVVGVLVYGGTFTVIAVFFNGLWAYAVHDLRLLDARFDPALARDISRQYRFGPVLYLAATFAAFLNVIISLVIFIALAVFFALPPRYVVPTSRSG